MKTWDIYINSHQVFPPNIFAENLGGKNTFVFRAVWVYNEKKKKKKKKSILASQSCLLRAFFFFFLIYFASRLCPDLPGSQPQIQARRKLRILM